MRCSELFSLRPKMSVITRTETSAGFVGALLSAVIPKMVSILPLTSLDTASIQSCHHQSAFDCVIRTRWPWSRLSLQEAGIEPHHCPAPISFQVPSHAQLPRTQTFRTSSQHVASHHAAETYEMLCSTALHPVAQPMNKTRPQDRIATIFPSSVVFINRSF